MSQLDFLRALREEEEEDAQEDGERPTGDVSPLTSDGNTVSEPAEGAAASKGWGHILAAQQDTTSASSEQPGGSGGGWGSILGGGAKRKADETWAEPASKTAKTGDESSTAEFPEAAHIKILFYASEGIEVSAEDVHNYKTSLKTTDKGSAAAQEASTGGPPRAFGLSDEHGENEAVGVASIPKEEFKEVLDKLVWSMDTDTEPLWRRAHPNELSAYFNYGLNEQLFREYMLDKQICLRLDRAKRNKITVGTYPAQGNLGMNAAPGGGPGRGLPGGPGQRHINPRDMEDMPGANDPKRSLYVCGFPAEWGEQELHDLFVKFGQLESVVIMPNRVGHSRGAGFVNYDDNVLSQQVVLAMNGYCVPDRPDCTLAVRFAKAKTQQLPAGSSGTRLSSRWQLG
ncbi:poly(A) binding protein, cytoplasmic 1-like [Perkinsus olseni]|uniref:Poly(A) binding protein, cytoplasmic 1-like n=2 Tax=Perkinsus olseni TaxID=32597 RepID=A0A7J6PJE3_PEROL|nr:poly(A) binding protein, cytoplasmic 1-like [Perkinsus olseni]